MLRQALVIGNFCDEVGNIVAKHCGKFAPRRIGILDRIVKNRAEHGNEINAIVAAWCKERTAREIQDVLERHEVPFGVACSVADIFADPHVAARGDIVAVDDPVIGTLRMQGVYPRFSNSPTEVPRGAPRLGEHNDEIYRGLLGLAPSELEALKTDRVI